MSKIISALRCMFGGHKWKLSVHRHNIAMTWYHREYVCRVCGKEKEETSDN